MCPPLDFQVVILMTVPVTSAEAERTLTGDKLNVFRVLIECCGENWIFLCQWFAYCEVTGLSGYSLRVTTVL